MSKKNFLVAIMHGHTADYSKLKNYVIECGYTPRILIEEYNAEIIFESLRNLVWEDIHCVLVLMTKDDEMKGGAQRARQNVVFELGYCFGAFDSLPDGASYEAKDALIIISEKDVELFADIDGLKRIIYESGKLEDQKELIKNALASSYKKAKEYYEF